MKCLLCGMSARLPVNASIRPVARHFLDLSLPFADCPNEGLPESRRQRVRALGGDRRAGEAPVPARARGHGEVQELRRNGQPGPCARRAELAAEQVAVGECARRRDVGPVRFQDVRTPWHPDRVVLRRPPSDRRAAGDYHGYRNARLLRRAAFRSRSRLRRSRAGRSARRERRPRRAWRKSSTGVTGDASAATWSFRRPFRPRTRGCVPTLRTACRCCLSLVSGRCTRRLPFS